MEEDFKNEFKRVEIDTLDTIYHSNNSKNSKNFDESVLEKEVNDKLFCIKVSTLLFILACLLLTILYFDILKGWFIDFIVYLKLHPLIGTLVIICIKIVGTILYVPGVLLAIGTGFAYKQMLQSYLSVPVGVLVIVIGSALGCSCVFLLSRFLIKDFAYKKLTGLKIFVGLNTALKHNGKKVNFLLRLTPLIPYNIANYFLGITDTLYEDYLFGLLGFIPLLTIYVFIGSTLNDLADMSFRHNRFEILLIGSSIFISIVCIFIITKIAKKELYDDLNEEIQLNETPTCI